MEANKIVIVGHGDTKHAARAIANAMRHSGMIASCYFDDDIRQTAKYLEGVGLVLFCLSRESRQPGTDQYRLEKELFDSIADMHERPPCGVLRDVDGYISAPYLVHHGLLVRLVFTDGDDGKQAPLELFGDFERHGVTNPIEQAGAIATQIADYLHVSPAFI